ncbi:hypothetical protein M2352_004771 [Azospirillum fermentarium]|uniref:hypothetical protein n=1 Tax=Azospirillum fermentarium TaxID=1233114 RepID=UPI0022262091|nr:hypothetical protein [Azospirillum fermentarium]MCW2249111.1 hypothetical protein [Azospirillum fermentarium]
MKPHSPAAVPLDPALVRRLLDLRAHGAGMAALLVDMGAIEHADDPRFSLSLLHYLESWAGPHPREVFRLPGFRVLVIAPVAARDALERGASALSHVLRHHSYGLVQCRVYDLGTEVPRLIADLMPGAADAPAASATVTPPVSGATLGRLLEMERTLAGANVEPLLREETLWSFADPAAPKPVLTELAVSLDELDSRLDLALHRDEWLRHEVGAMLDRGLLRHIARDRGATRRRFSFDLHSATVLDDGFGDLVRAIPAEVRGRLTVELASWEAGLSPARFAAAAARLADLGFGVALDRVPLEALATLDLGGAAVDFVKVIGCDAPDAAHLAAGVERFGAGRLVLWRCITAALLDTALGAGVRLFQGHAADERAAAPAASATPAPPPDVEAAGPGGEGAEEAPPEPPGLLARLLGRG